MSDINWIGSKPKRTICEVHREIYDELIEIKGSGKAITLLSEAYELGKKIAAKLVKLEGMDGYMEEMDYPLNYNYTKSLKRRANRG